MQPLPLGRRRAAARDAHARARAVVAPGVLAALREEHPAELGQPRQLARFLCGLSSPATTRARLSRHELYGALAAHRFAAVLRAIGPSGTA